MKYHLSFQRQPFVVFIYWRNCLNCFEFLKFKTKPFLNTRSPWISSSEIPFEIILLMMANWVN